MPVMSPAPGFRFEGVRLESGHQQHDGEGTGRQPSVHGRSMAQSRGRGGAARHDSRVRSVEHSGGCALVVDPVLADVEELALLAVVLVLAAARASRGARAGAATCAGT